MPGNQTRLPGSEVPASACGSFMQPGAPALIAPSHFRTAVWRSCRGKAVRHVLPPAGNSACGYVAVAAADCNGNRTKS